jgi:hypothetical protein
LHSTHYLKTEQQESAVVPLTGYADRFSAAPGESITRALQGERAPFANRPPAGSVNGGAAAELMATRVLVARQRLGEGLLTAFDDTADRFTYLMTRLTAAEAETACYHPANLLPVRTFVGLRLCELVVHGWDIRSLLESTAALSPESAAVLVEWWPEFVTWGFQPDTSLVTGGAVSFRIHGQRAPSV